MTSSAEAAVIRGASGSPAVGRLVQVAHALPAPQYQSVVRMDQLRRLCSRRPVSKGFLDKGHAPTRGACPFHVSLIGPSSTILP